jgi:DNA-binding CsgD family transcriptional regulator
VITTLVKVALQSSSSRGARPQSTRAAPHAVILVAGAASGTKILDWLVQTAPPRIGSRRRDGHPHGYCRPAGALAMARQAGSLFDQGEALRVTADLDIVADRVPGARAHLRQAIELCSRIGYGPVLIDCLDSCAYLGAATECWAEAITMWAACTSALRAAGMQADLPHGAERREQGLRQARQALGPEAARAAEDRGTAMNLATATQYALLLVSEQPGEAAGMAGVPRLSARERELVTLVAHGRTNAEIAAQLFISVRAVRSHLDRIRDKTGCRRRADLTRLAVRAGLV